MDEKQQYKFPNSWITNWRQYPYETAFAIIFLAGFAGGAIYVWHRVFYYLISTPTSELKSIDWHMQILAGVVVFLSVCLLIVFFFSFSTASWGTDPDGNDVRVCPFPVEYCGHQWWKWAILLYLLLYGVGCFLLHRTQQKSTWMYWVFYIWSVPLWALLRIVTTVVLLFLARASVGTLYT